MGSLRTAPWPRTCKCRPTGTMDCGRASRWWVMTIRANGSSGRPRWIIPRRWWSDCDILPTRFCLCPRRAWMFARSDGSKQTRTVREVTVAPLTTSEVEIMPDAWKQWEKYSRAVSYDMLPEIPSTVPAKFYASYGRMGTMLIKVAIILAAFDATCLPVTVQAAHVYRAQIIVETWRANLHRIFAKTSEVRDTGISDELRMVLAAKGSDWTPRRELLRSLKKLWSDIELEIGDLEASGEIERRPTAKRGPASEEYRLVTEVRA